MDIEALTKMADGNLWHMDCSRNSNLEPCKICPKKYKNHRD